MSHFRAFEVEALRLLGGARLGAKLLDAICNGAKFVSYTHSGVGYFLTVRHHLLPKARAVFHEPLIIGSVGEVAGTYLAFVQDNALTLEYAGFSDVPANFRDLPVQIAVRGRAT